MSIKINLEQRDLTLVELILLRNYYKEHLDSYVKEGFNENNNNHRIVEERYKRLDMELRNLSNQLHWNL